jgi:hypothetical protein
MICLEAEVLQCLKCMARSLQLHMGTTVQCTVNIQVWPILCEYDCTDSMVWSYHGHMMGLYSSTATACLK